MTTTVKHNGRAMGRRARGPDESTYTGRFAARLKKLRVKAGMDHDQAADAITRAGWAVTTPTIYRWEQGKTFPSYEALPFIAAAYGCPSIHAIVPKQ